MDRRGTVSIIKGAVSILDIGLSSTGAICTMAEAAVTKTTDVASIAAVAKTMVWMTMVLEKMVLKVVMS